MARPDLDHLQPPLRAALQVASDDLQRQGILLDSHITQGFRTYQQQVDIYNRRGQPGIYTPALPGTSPHEFGRAVDISLVGWGEDQKQAVMTALQQQGMYRPHPVTDPVHWQLLHPGQATQPEPPRPPTPPVFPVAQPSQQQAQQQQPGQYPADGTMIPFASTMLAAAGYRAEVKELICEFQKTGRVYTYLAVPQDVWVGLVEAGSKGQYMRQLVIGIYPF